MNEISWFFIGHMVCVSQWAAFLLVDRAYLGKGRVKHVGFWSVVLVAGMLAFSLIFQIGFFTLEPSGGMWAMCCCPPCCSAGRCPRS